jgi:hypothetical protein
MRGMIRDGIDRRIGHDKHGGIRFPGVGDAADAAEQYNIGRLVRQPFARHIER